ncbi:MAG: ATP-binding protein, partial [Burkholderiales bacterium]
MTETPGAGEGEGTRTRGSIARRMLVAAAIWSAVVLLVAGWSLQAFYRAEADQQLDLANRDTLVTLANAVNSDELGEAQFDDSKLPKDEKFGMTFSGRYWAFLDVNDQAQMTRAKQSPSFFEEPPELPNGALANALAHPGETVQVDAVAPNDRLVRVGLQAVTLSARELPIVLYSGIDRTAVDEGVGRFTLRLGIALGVLALGIVIGVVVLIRYGLRPLHEIQDKLGDVRAGRRDKLDGEYPGELSPLVKEINTLIVQNRKVVDRARTHVGNLAHALKTPLAVLKNEAKGTDRVSEIVRRQTDAMTSNVNHYLKRAQAAAQAEVLGARTEVKEPVEGIAR